MDFFEPKVKHFGLKLIGMFAVTAVLAVVYIYFIDYLNLGFTVMPLVVEILLGLTMILLSRVWLKVSLFSRPEHWQVGTIAMLVMLVVCFIDIGPLPHFSPRRLELALLWGAAAGIFEEVLCRGPFLFFVFKHTPRQLSPYWWTAIVTSLVFGVMHLSNASAKQDLVQTLIQVGYAAAFGFGAVALFLFTRNLGFSMFLHFASDAVGYYFAGTITSYTDTSDWVTWVILLIMVSVHIGLGIYLLSRVSRTQKEPAVE